MRQRAGTRIFTAACLVFSFANIEPGMAQGDLSGCNKPPTCSQIDPIAQAYGNKMSSKIAALGGSITMSSVYGWCGLEVAAEAVKVCAAEYASVGKPQCANALNQQLAQVRTTQSQMQSNYNATSTVSTPIQNMCDFKQ